MKLELKHLWGIQTCHFLYFYTEVQPLCRHFGISISESFSSAGSSQCATRWQMFFPLSCSTLNSGVNSAVLYLVDRPSQRARGLDSSSVAGNSFS